MLSRTHDSPWGYALLRPLTTYDSWMLLSQLIDVERCRSLKQALVKYPQAHHTDTIYSHACTHARTHTHTHTHTHAHTHARAHTHTHTHLVEVAGGLVGSSEGSDGGGSVVGRGSNCDRARTGGTITHITLHRCLQQQCTLGSTSHTMYVLHTYVCTTYLRMYMWFWTTKYSHDAQHTMILHAHFSTVENPTKQSYE